ncbi:hypothetical protein [Actinomadura keratinilytica]|uniref:Uncharacterized protein n=1 Tax=Actinomadura keratinilytica TaxID=547461 RepID=A0ABP7YKP9_9ACTN
MTEGRYRIKRHFSVIAHSPDRIESRHGVWNAQSVVVDDQEANGRLAAIVAALESAPRTRGWSATLRHLATVSQVGPAHAGIVRRSQGG